MARRAGHALDGKLLRHIADEAQLQREARVNLLGRWRNAGFIVDDDQFAICSSVNTVNPPPDGDAFDMDGAGLLGNRHDAALFGHQASGFICHPA